MSTLRNRVQLIGHLGADPETRTVNNGAKVAQLRIATTDKYKTGNGEWKEDTQWHRISAWEALAERMEKQLVKGSYVMIEGKLTTTISVDNQGNKKYFTDIRAFNFIKLDKKPERQDSEPVVPVALVQEADDGLPF